MATLTRLRRINVDASPNQFYTNPDPTRAIALSGYNLYNPNTSDVWVSFYTETSGSVTVGTTTRTYGPILVPAGSQIIAAAASEQSPIMFFTNAITVACTTSSNGSTSPSLDIEVELIYYA